jgi:hypothetical protein
LGVLAASLAHEIRNSLAVVTVAVEVLGSDYAEQTEQRHVVKEILRRLDGVNNLVGDLLECTKPPVAKKEVVRLLESGRCSCRADARYAAAVHHDRQGVSLQSCFAGGSQPAGAPVPESHPERGPGHEILWGAHNPSCREQQERLDFFRRQGLWDGKGRPGENFWAFLHHEGGWIWPGPVPV